MSSSPSRSEHFSLNTSQLTESNEDDNNRDVLERTEDDEDDSFHPELEDDELSTDARTLIEFSQQIASASETGCSTQAVSEELVDLQRLRRTQKIFKELQFNNPGRQLVESLSTDGLTEYASNRPKRNKNRNRTTNEDLNSSLNNLLKTSEKYSHQGFCYRKNKGSSDGQIIFWVCVDRRNDCKGRVWTTSCESRKFIRLVTEHSCTLESSRNTNKSSNYTGKLFHNQKGHLTTSRGAVDLCDCLDLECSGCNYPCKKCGSQKCSYSCRNNRRTYIESIDELGSGSTKNPFL
ncbi:unnamed protein product [Meloidogyne enterolobii]|uniref:Uncharacterized protein n=1 Tax=Meloidogyne enterolobii TaxID=390850 RepID=A0ACB0YCF1_MELEN